jgi:hypothetical protein
MSDLVKSWSQRIAALWATETGSRTELSTVRDISSLIRNGWHVSNGWVWLSTAVENTQTRITGSWHSMRLSADGNPKYPWGWFITSPGPIIPSSLLSLQRYWIELGLGSSRRYFFRQKLRSWFNQLYLLSYSKFYHMGYDSSNQLYSLLVVLLFMFLFGCSSGYYWGPRRRTKEP